MLFEQRAGHARQPTSNRITRQPLPSMRKAIQRLKKRDERDDGIMAGSQTAAGSSEPSSQQQPPSSARSPTRDSRTGDEDEEEFFDDASTIGPAPSEAAPSLFGDDDASTLQPDTYPPLGASTAGGAGTRPQPWLRDRQEEVYHVNGDGSYAGPGAGAGGGAGRRWAGGAGARSQQQQHQRHQPHRPPPQEDEGPDYWHEEPAPYNPFDEVARLPQRERVALAMKNAQGPRYDELRVGGGWGGGFGVA